MVHNAYNVKIRLTHFLLRTFIATTLQLCFSVRHYEG
jgi:hypothetical protein